PWGAACRWPRGDPGSRARSIPAVPPRADSSHRVLALAAPFRSPLRTAPTRVGKAAAPLVPPDSERCALLGAHGYRRAEAPPVTSARKADSRFAVLPLPVPPASSPIAFGASPIGTSVPGACALQHPTERRRGTSIPVLRSFPMILLGLSKESGAR